ncbi:MAG: hypothetical protein BM485_17035 [Desulfobulbaceae bacterium DB1]|nr:MAG: hypothetical protein BM485_17035 [Desulfobulbaceae bacterium DB1]
MVTKEIKPPNVFLIGAPKAGTSALADALSQHPDIFMGKKEPRFFDAESFYDFVSDYPIASLDEYLQFFSSDVAQKSNFRLDASVFNMYSSQSIERILSVSPDAKFIVMLRDPITASKSMHNQRLKYTDPAMREVSEDFCACWRLLEQRKRGLGFPKGCRNRILFRYDYLYHYEWHLPKCLALINKNQQIVLRYEEFKANPLSVCMQIFSHLGIDISFNPQLGIVNPSLVTENNMWNSFIQALIQKTAGARKVIGLRGSRLKLIKNILPKLMKTRKPTVANECDELLEEEFYETYMFLEQIESQHNPTERHVRLRKIICSDAKSNTNPCF